MKKDREEIKIDDPKWVEKNVEVRYPRVVAGDHKGRIYKAYRYKDCLYWTLEDIRDGIPAIKRSGMKGFRREEHIYRPPVGLGKVPPTKTGNSLEHAGKLPSFGSELPWKDGEAMTDNRGVCLREDEKRKGWCEERERTDAVCSPKMPQASGVKMYVDTVTGCADGQMVKFRRYDGTYKYKGRKRLDDVKSLTFRAGFVPDSEHRKFNDGDIVFIDGTSLGHGDTSVCFAGVYVIQLPSEKKLKVAQHGDLFPSLRRDLSNATSPNWKAGVKRLGVSGTRIRISEHIADEEERKERKRAFVLQARAKGLELYNNERTVSDGMEPVGEYTALVAFEYRIGNGGEFRRVESSDIIGDVCRIYSSEGGCELGMEIYIE